MICCLLGGRKLVASEWFFELCLCPVTYKWNRKFLNNFFFLCVCTWTDHTLLHLLPSFGHTCPSTSPPKKVLITEKSDVMCCAIFRDIHISWRWEAEPLLLSHLPQEAVNTSWPPLEAASWVWRLLEPGGGPWLLQLLSLSLKHTLNA